MAQADLSNERLANIDDALRLVVHHFHGVKDKDGEPYVMHCLRVMMGVADPMGQMVGLMHDLIEDTEVTLEELRQLGFADEIITAVDLVTHQAADSYANYVVRIKQNDLARQVKLSDLRDNTAMGRVLYRDGQTDDDAKRIQRYVLSYQYLSDRIDESHYRRRMHQLEDGQRD